MTVLANCELFERLTSIKMIRQGSTFIRSFEKFRNRLYINYNLLVISEIEKMEIKIEHYFSTS